MSSTPTAIDGDRVCKRLTAEGCTFRRVHFWSFVEQAHDCHRLAKVMESYLIYFDSIRFSAYSQADDKPIIGFFVVNKGKAQK